MNIMDAIRITKTVNLELQNYLESGNFSQVVVLVDENTKRDCYPLIEFQEHTIIEIRSGELNKNITTCSQIWDALTRAQCDRNALLINLGGGVIGDLGGFCARTYKRGIRFVNIPTTLLAQVDASVGGKLGIDFKGFKNHIGLFSKPDSVIIDPIFLESLPREELISGFAEVIKHNLIADAEGWKRLAKTEFQNIDWFKTISHSVKIKRDITSADFKESGQRKILNLGHTIGHALESYYLPTETSLLHGEAVALGIICESFMSLKRDMLSIKEFDEIHTFIKKHFPIRSIPESAFPKILELMQQDKKNKEGMILSVLLKSIGKAEWDQEITMEEVIASLKYLNQT